MVELLLLRWRQVVGDDSAGSAGQCGDAAWWDGKVNGVVVTICQLGLGLGLGLRWILAQLLRLMLLAFGMVPGGVQAGMAELLVGLETWEVLRGVGPWEEHGAGEGKGKGAGVATELSAQFHVFLFVAMKLKDVGVS